MYLVIVLYFIFRLCDSLNLDTVILKHLTMISFLKLCNCYQIRKFWIIIWIWFYENSSSNSCRIYSIKLVWCVGDTYALNQDGVRNSNYLHIFCPVYWTAGRSLWPSDCDKIIHDSFQQKKILLYII